MSEGKVTEGQTWIPFSASLHPFRGVCVCVCVCVWWDGTGCRSPGQMFDQESADRRPRCAVRRPNRHLTSESHMEWSYFVFSSSCCRLRSVCRRCCRMTASPSDCSWKLFPTKNMSLESKTSPGGVWNQNMTPVRYWKTAKQRTGRLAVLTWSHQTAHK